MSDAAMMQSGLDAAAQRSLVIANAGSGKTWTLANRFLSWCMDELRRGRKPDPARILALTFTRKAAGEILARVLTHAAMGASDARARERFQAVVGPATEEEYLTVLEALCRDLHRMQVGTIDGFFHRIATALPQEAGLPPEWTIGDDREVAEVRASVAANILALDVAGELLDLLEDGAPKPSVTSAIAGLLGASSGPARIGSSNVLALYRASIGAAPDVATRAERLDKSWNWVARLRASEPVPSQSLDALLLDLQEAELPLTSAKVVHKTWAKAHSELCKLLEARDFREVAKSKFLRAIAGDGTFSKVVANDKLLDIGKAIGSHVRRELLADLARRIDGALRVLPHADSMLDAEQAERGIYGFADIGRGVARAAMRAGSRTGNPDALRRALGSDIRDLAIDEAQDTSVEQFLTLRPLMREVLGATDPTRAGRFLLVGDPKQSIYGWRGGTPGLIEKIESDFGPYLGAGEALTQSFRSAPILMDFVNRVFGDLESDVLRSVEPEDCESLVGLQDFLERERLPGELCGSAFKRAVAQWRFAIHEASNAGLSGHIEVYACGESEPLGESELSKRAEQGSDAGPIVVDRLACAAAVAARLHTAHPGRSVGVLVRRNSDAAAIVALLRRDGVAVSDEGQSSLLDSPAVSGLVAMLQLIDDPSNRIAHFLVSRGAMSAVTKLPPLESHTSLNDAYRCAWDYAAVMRARIADQGLPLVIAEAAEALVEQGLGVRDRARVARFVAVADRFQDRQPARMSEFLEEVAADKADASSGDMIRVMTIHKSKGLEFDEVILPSLDDAWGETPTGWGVLATDPSEPPQLVAPMSSTDIRGWIPELALFERDERRRGLLDDLSSFYVAVTRARTGLHLMIDRKQGGKYPTAAKVILAAMARADPKPTSLQSAPDLTRELANAQPSLEASCWSVATDGGRVPSIGAPSPATATPREAVATPLVPVATPLVNFIGRPRARVAAPSTHAAPSLWAFDPFGDDDTALRGVLVHECFREVRDIADLVAAHVAAHVDGHTIDRLLSRAARRSAIEKGCPLPPAMVEEVRALLCRIVAGVGVSGSIAEALRVSGSDVVHTELPYVRELPDGGLGNGRIDRLVLHTQVGNSGVSRPEGLDEGAPHREHGSAASIPARFVGATIIDFKTGAKAATPDALRDTIVNYTEQMHAYCAAIEDLWVLAPGTVGARLLFVDRGEVVDIAGDARV